VSSARNVGLDYAKGEFVVFVDADDIITPPHLSEYQQYSVDVAISGIIIDKGGESITEIISDVSRNIKVEDIGHFIDENSATSVFRGPFCKAFRRNVIEKNHIRFDERLSWGEDYLFVLEILSKSQSVAVLSGSTYIYYADSVTSGKYQMTSVQYELYITQTEQILKEYNFNKFIDINRLWAYQTMLGFIGSRSMREKMRECFKFILGRHWHYLPERQRRSKLNFLIELIRVALLS